MKNQIVSIKLLKRYRLLTESFKKNIKKGVVQVLIIILMTIFLPTILNQRPACSLDNDYFNLNLAKYC